MAVQRKHSDLPPRYEATEFTTEQRHRFTKVANAAQTVSYTHLTLPTTVDV